MQFEAKPPIAVRSGARAQPGAPVPIASVFLVHFLLIEALKSVASQNIIYFLDKIIKNFFLI
jgi:hypothetical protein